MGSSLREAREKKHTDAGEWFRKHFPFLFNPKSVFYFALIVFLIGMAWDAIGLIDNNFTNFYNFDYVWQFVPFAYDVHDSWRTFFATGQFPLYNTTVYLGTDNIGSNSYYGLFDPFVVWMVIFPRSWIPQLFAISTFAKFMVTALFMRLYLKQLGIKESTARIGALALAFSGYMNFMVAFPTTVSAIVYVPLILYGIEKLISERKPGALLVGLFLEGITSFFFLVVLCIWGVIYALWRFFWSIKKRNGKENVTVMVMGVAAFAIGLFLSSFSLLPSIRQSTLSGRTSSIGASYLNAIGESLKARDIGSFFSLIFQQVGLNPGRELMGLVSFFFPTFGFQSLPITWTGTINSNYFMSIGYDAYTASIFCYTPFVILFFNAIINSIRKKKVSHLIAVALCCYLLFTNFAYYFFYAFTGNGYARWFMILIPEIIYYGCWAFDQRKEQPKWVPFASTALAFVGTIATYYLTVGLLDGKTFSQPGEYYEGGYWQSTYHVPSFDTMLVLDRVYDDNGNLLYLIQYPTITYVFVQCGLVIVEGLLYSFFYAKKWISKVMFGFVAVEAIVVGNLSYTFNWTYNSWFGGSDNRETATSISDGIKAQDGSFYRTIMDMANGAETFQNVAGYNFTSTFHSLMNFDVEDFALNNRMKTNWDTKKGHDGKTIRNPQWSGYYGNKRLETDVALGYRYYVNKTYWSAKEFINTNAPFFTEELVDLSPDRNLYRIYKVKDEYNVGLGHAVDDSKLYYLIHEDKNYMDRSNFHSTAYGKNSYLEILRAEDVEVYGAMINEGETIDGFNISSTAPSLGSYESSLYYYGSSGHTFSATDYITSGNNMLFSSQYSDEGLGYFKNHYDTKKVITSSSYSLKRDYGHLCLTPNDGEYFCDDEKGAYVEIGFCAGTSGMPLSVVPRVYMLGDVKDGLGNVKHNQLLTFDYKTMSNAKNSGSSYFSSYSSTFGFYVKDALITDIVYCFEDSSGLPVSLNLNSISLKVTPYTQEESKRLSLMEDSLKEVKRDVNSFTFKTNYSKQRIVVTTLGYDAGWSCEATKSTGEKVKCQMLKLDGGLVGFVAPMGEVSYCLSYCTPYLKGAAALGMFGFASYLTYAAFGFVRAVKAEKKRREELKIVA